MAKLKINGLSLEAKLPEAPKVEKPSAVVEKAVNQVMIEQSDVINKLMVSEVNDKIDELKLDAISIKSHLDVMANEKIGLVSKVAQMSSEVNNNIHSISGLKSEIAGLQKQLKEVSRPIVKEIKMASHPEKELEVLEKGIKKTVDRVSEARKIEIDLVSKTVKTMNKHQKIINAVMICSLILMLIYK